MKAHASSVATQDNYYWYDGLQQVTRHDRGDLTPSSGPPYTGIDPSNRQQQEDFTFDQTGNWTQFQTQSPSLVQTRTHDKANQIASLTNPSSVIQPVFDATGNMTTMPKPGNWTTSNTLQWDAWNRLVKLTEGSSTITYAYDALTRRTTKTNSSETRHYYYDRQWRAVEERVAGASITVDRQYTWSPIDRWTLIRRKRSVTTSLDETRFVLKDYLDPAAIIDDSAAVDERFGYDAFGKLNLMTPAFAARTTSVCDWNFLFHAEFLDSDSGLYNYGYRYYHPELGRWISRDPEQERDGLNLYSFVANNSLNLLDYVGLCGVTIDVSHGGLRTSRSTQRANARIESNDSEDCQRFIQVGCGANKINRLYFDAGIGVIGYPQNDWTNSHDSPTLKKNGFNENDLCQSPKLAQHIDEAYGAAVTAAYMMCADPCCCEEVIIKISCEGSIEDPGDINKFERETQSATGRSPRCGEITKISCKF